MTLSLTLSALIAAAAAVCALGRRIERRSRRGRIELAFDLDAPDVRARLGGL